MIGTFHKDYLEKLIATSPSLNSVASMTWPTVKSMLETTAKPKRKQGRSRFAKSANRTKKNKLRKPILLVLGN